MPPLSGRHRDPDSNPYQSPRSYDTERSRGDLLKAYGWERIQAQGCLSLSEVLRTYFDVRRPTEHIVVTILVAGLFVLPLAVLSMFACILGLRYGELWRTVWGGWGFLFFGVITPLLLLRDCVRVRRVKHLCDAGQGVFAYQERIIWLQPPDRVRLRSLG